jgi:hypothetical protein
LPKYSYRPILEKVQEAYLENAKTEYTPGVDITSAVSLVVEADSEDAAQKICYGFIDVRMWELVDENQQTLS